MNILMKPLTFGEKVLDFYRILTPPSILVKGIEVIQPHKDSEVWQYTEKFFDTFFQDTNDRIFIFGINPGRFGSGMTGIPFTDPIALENVCGIPNTIVKRRETSSDFIYKSIEAFGGIHDFYSKFFLTAVSPIGFTHNGINCNYYDRHELFSAVRPFIIETMQMQIAFGARTDAAIVLGSGKNQKVFSELNREYDWFNKLYILEHPRFIMQYRRKYVDDYLKKYRNTFLQAF